VKPRLFVSGLLIFFLFAIGTTVRAADVDAGKELYTQYCGSCHGEDGRGNGPVSAYLKIKVPDLTLLRKNNKGIYPMDQVMSAIDGRRTVRAHGDRKMPVWGEIFRKEAEGGKYAELQALLKAKLIAEYIATIQQ
jgi:mono/diheme cytochrome c family protein